MGCTVFRAVVFMPRLGRGRGLGTDAGRWAVAIAANRLDRQFQAQAPDQIKSDPGFWTVI